MKKWTALLLVLLLMASVCAKAENTTTVYDTMVRLIGGKQFTLTVTAEASDELADIIAPYGTVTCILRQENDQITLNASCEGDAYLNVYASAEAVRFETNLIENGVFESDWDALAPKVSVDAHQINVTMTGPDHELISFSCKVTGDHPADCEVEVHIGFITGPGNVHSLWDGIYNNDGETSREFYFTFSEEEYAIEGEGTNTVETAEDGSMILFREEECTVTYNEDEIGTVAIRSTLTIQ